MLFVTSLGDEFCVPEAWWHAAGAMGLLASGSSFIPGVPERAGLPHGQEVAIATIRPPRRFVGTAGLVRDRAISILTAFAQGLALPPVVIYAVPDGAFTYRLGEGFHRFHLSIAAGYTHIPAVILSYWEPWMTCDPTP